MQKILYDLKTREEENLDCYVRLEYTKNCSHKMFYEVVKILRIQEITRHPTEGCREIS